MPTSFPMSNPWVHGEVVDEVKAQARITTPINDLAAALHPDTPAGANLGSVNTNTAATSSGVTEVLHTGLAITVAGIVSGRSYFLEFGWKWVVSAAGTAVGVIHASQGTISTASPVVAGVQMPVAATGAGGPEMTYRVLWTATASGTWNFQAGVKSLVAGYNSQIVNGQQNCFLNLVGG